MLEVATIAAGTIPAGHTVREVNGVPQEWAGNTFIRNIPLVWHELTGSLVIGNQNNITTFVREKKMQGSQDTLTEVIEQSNGTVIFRFANGGDEPYSSWEDVGAVADSLDTDDGAMARKIIKAQAYRASPSGANKTAMVGASCLVSIQPNAVPVVFTPPQG